jgi:hypothetical protein
MQFTRNAKLLWVVHGHRGPTMVDGPPPPGPENTTSFENDFQFHFQVDNSRGSRRAKTTTVNAASGGVNGENGTVACEKREPVLASASGFSLEFLVG